MDVQTLNNTVLNNSKNNSKNPSEAPKLPCKLAELCENLNCPCSHLDLPDTKSKTNYFNGYKPPVDG